MIREGTKILVVEDDASIVRLLELELEHRGLSVRTALDGVAGLAEAARFKPDVIVLDIMLPKLDGTEVCRRIRSQSDVPILMLTAKDDEIDRVVGLELGADDYVTKPFSMRELTARVRAVLRRGFPYDAEDADAPLEVQDVRMNPERHEVFVRGESVDLPPKEFQLLELLLRNAGRVLTRDVIMQRVWGTDHIGDTKTIDVHVKRLRSRIEAQGDDPKLIVTVRGLGYKFAD